VNVRTEFVTSAAGAAGFPQERLPELAVAGRSNVGKSSLINALVRQKVARTSAAPGKTRLANFFRVVRDGAPPFHLVDLPGYGYARGGDAAAREFEVLTSAYFSARRPAAVLLLVDSRHPGLDSDGLASAWLRTLDTARIIVATKVDKLTRAERTRHLTALERLHQAPVLGVSAHTGEGLKELWKEIDKRLRPRPPATDPPPPPPHQNKSRST
jgi:GTP-binding protein